MNSAERLIADLEKSGAVVSVSVISLRGTKPGVARVKSVSINGKSMLIRFRGESEIATILANARSVDGVIEILDDYR